MSANHLVSTVSAPYQQQSTSDRAHYNLRRRGPETALSYSALIQETTINNNNNNLFECLFLVIVKLSLLEPA